MKTKLEKLLSSAGFMVIGGIAGFFMARILLSSLDEGSNLIPTLLFLCVVMFVEMFISFIIHEGGHLVMGLLTGYKFVSFRVGTFTLVRENGKLVRKKYNIVGTAGQCIMTHDLVDDPASIPFFWYHFGGIMFNFITALLFLPAILIAENEIVKSGCSIAAVVALGIGIMNLFPTKAGGVGTDGYNILKLIKSPAARSAAYKNLVLNGMMYSGKKWSDIPEELISYTKEEADSEYGAALLLNEAALLENRHEFAGAEEKYRSIAGNDSVIGVYVNEAKCEMMFCMIMNGRSAEEIDAVYDKELKRYIDLTEKTYITRKRLLYAYYLLTAKDSEKAAAEYDGALKMKNTYPSVGEYLDEMELIEYIRSFAGKPAEEETK